MSRMNIGGRRIGPGNPTFIVAEMSANHGQSLDQAIEIVKLAHASGADAVKLQTYTPDTLTIDCDNEHFRIQGTIWNGQTLYDLYQGAFTPWEWHPKLKEVATDLGLEFFSTPFDPSSVDFLEDLGVPAHKIASFEIVDLALLEKVATTGKPIILSTGMATLSEIEEAIQTIRNGATDELALLKCTSAYPSPPEEMNLNAIPYLADTFDLPIGLSDHTMETAVPVAAVALGACIIEKHFTISRENPGADSAFSLEPQEFRAMVDAVRTTERALGDARPEIGEKEAQNRVFRRSLFVVEDLQAGDTFTASNVRSIRPGSGLEPKHLAAVLRKRATAPIPRGTPLRWTHVGQTHEANDRTHA